MLLIGFYFNFLQHILCLTSQRQTYIQKRRVIFDIVHVLTEECTLSQALIPDKKTPSLSMLAASQTRDKGAWGAYSMFILPLHSTDNSHYFTINNIGT